MNNFLTHPTYASLFFYENAFAPQVRKSYSKYMYVYIHIYEYINQKL